MEKIIIILVTIILVIFIFYISTPFKNTGQSYCVMRINAKSVNYLFLCPGIGNICQFDNKLYQCKACCVLNTIDIVTNHLLILAIICFVLFMLWRIFRNKLKKEEIGIIVKTLLFLGIIALILFFLLFYIVRNPMPV